jgi:Zn-finger nucleic acid-binding protein
MQCLNCKIEMVNHDVITKHAQLSYDACEQCGSLWLDAGGHHVKLHVTTGSSSYDI